MNGETIPTLEEALDVIIMETELLMVWLDVKDASITDKIITIQRRKAEEAAAVGREVQILFGIPDADVFDKYKASPLFGTVETLCELDPTDVTAIDARAWAPRFTAGVQRDKAQQMHDEGRNVAVWTVDDPEFISLFLNEKYKGRPLYSGILTNYPTLLAARFYSLKVKP